MSTHNKKGMTLIDEVIQKPERYSRELKTFQVSAEYAITPQISFAIRPVRPMLIKSIFAGVAGSDTELYNVKVSVIPSASGVPVMNKEPNGVTYLTGALANTLYYMFGPSSGKVECELYMPNNLSCQFTVDPFFAAVPGGPFLFLTLEYFDYLQ